MKKIMLSVLVMLLVSFFAFATSPQSYALTDEEVAILYVEAPEGWESPHVWTWNESGDNAYGLLGWPGKAMLADENNPGWFYLYVPVTMEQVIVNNGLTDDNAKQTEAFAISGENVWVTIALDDVDPAKLIGTPSTTQATTGDLPLFVDTVYIFALVPIDWDDAAIWAWTHPAGTNVFPDASWPGTAMELQSDGWFRVEIPAVANRVIINDNNEVAADVVQTVDIDLLGGNNYIVVGDAGDDGKFAFEIYDEKPVIIEDGFTIHVSVPDAWTAPNAWAWSHPDGTNLYAAWPGDPLTYDESSDTWTLVVPNWVNRVIINNDIEGTVYQTVDIDLPTEGEEFNLVIGEAGDDGKYAFEISVVNNETPEEPEEPETPEEPEDPQDPEPESNQATLWIILGSVAGVAAIGGVAVFLILKKRSA